jgi:hypothetical protein
LVDRLVTVQPEFIDQNYNVSIAQPASTPVMEQKNTPSLCIYALSPGRVQLLTQSNQLSTARALQKVQPTSVSTVALSLPIQQIGTCDSTTFCKNTNLAIAINRVFSMPKISAPTSSIATQERAATG